MKRQDLLVVAEKLMKCKKGHSHRETGFEFHHGRRTAKIALQLREKIFRDSSHDDIIFAGSLFHDVGKGWEPHNETGEAIVREALVGVVTACELEQISEIVLLHNQRGEQAKSYPDFVRLVQDADLIDHDGTIDVWMNFWYHACEDESMLTSIEYFEKVNQIDQSQRQELLNYDYSRTVQKKRFEFEQLFFKRFRMEEEGRIV